MCGICGKLDKDWLCTKCRKKLQFQSICKIDDYKETSSYFDEHIYCFQYDGQIRDLILNYKFNEKAYLYETFVSFIKNNEKICLQLKKYDIIIPVPISKKRFRERGYNQSSIFAKALAKSMEIEYREDILIKIKDNKKQSTLTSDERIKNTEKVYKIKNKIDNLDKRILIVDDIFTTGSTVNECSKILKEELVNCIGIFTIAKD